MGSDLINITMEMLGFFFYLSEMLEDVVDDDFLGFVGMNSGEGIHVDDGVFKTNQRESQGAFQSLQSHRRKERKKIRQKKGENRFTHAVQMTSC